MTETDRLHSVLLLQLEQELSKKLDEVEGQFLILKGTIQQT